MSQTINSSQKNTSKKFKALLAGGVVLGVGAVVTLAAWTDQEWASGDFRAGTFNIESSTTGEDSSFDGNPGTDTDNPDTDKAAELEFEVAADNMHPGHTVAAPYFLRLSEDTTYDAKVQFTEAQTVGDSPNAEHLAYEIIKIDPAAACTPDAKGKLIAGEAQLGTEPEKKATFDLSQGSDAAGEPVQLCFLVSASSELQQGESALARWEFTGTSK